MASKNPESDADRLREEMRELRSHMDADVDSFVENTRGLLDWHSYFRSAPWLCLGAAALAGYMVVPSKTRWVTIDIDKLAELAKNHRVAVTEKSAPSKGSVGSSLGKMVFDLLWRTALAAATQHVNQLLSPRPKPKGPSSGAVSPEGSDRRPAGGEGK